MASKRYSATIGRCRKKLILSAVCICAGGLCESLVFQWEGGIGAVMGAAVQCVWVSENSAHCYTTVLLQNSTALTGTAPLAFITGLNIKADGTQVIFELTQPPSPFHVYQCSRNSYMLEL